jgi:hypothetical protein
LKIWTNGAVKSSSSHFSKRASEKFLHFSKIFGKVEIKEIDSFAETAADEFE